ncbi:MAG TPA: type I secretion system permease/ATPase [Hyphomicrobiales bacterium]|nr:type I secretion system permease/ATPase [Hyphomicrobiales bacterium]
MKNVVAGAYRKLVGGYVVVAVLSCAVNLLMLTGPLFMLQVYDRVLASRSVPTLTALVILAAGLYAMMGVFDLVRNRILSRVSQRLDDELSRPAFRSWLVRSLGGHAPGYRPLQDLATVRGFLSSPTMTALFDLPWFPAFLAVVYLLHFQLGVIASIGAGVVIVIAFVNEFMSSRPARDYGQAEIAENRFTEQVQRGADAVIAMGMLGDVSGRWKGLRDTALFFLQKGTERSEYFTALSKAFRLLLQSLILGYAAYLAIFEEITPGMIVAASIIAGRALAPLDQVVGGWRMLKRARLANSRLKDYLARDAEATPVSVRLPDPVGRLDVTNVTKYTPGQAGAADRRSILSGISFNLSPGEGLGIIGPSASGKTSLARLLVGLWMPDQGHVRIDGATHEQWDPDDLGRFIGYLPQQIELFPGSIAQNIARFRPDVASEDIVAAAMAAGVHEFILRFPAGYATEAEGPASPLTGGLRQRIALARAIFGSPALVVLDEPNSNLDAEGDEALTRAIATLRERGAAVVVMAHRPSAIAAVDKVLMLNEGRVLEFGDKSEVLRKVTRVT